MTLTVGARVNTLLDAKALLTFYNGSTTELDPGTDLEIQRSESDGKSSNIVLKQYLGKTVSRVIELIDPGSRYEIQTPSAFALVRGTLFSVEIVGLNNTVVKVIEKTVTVGAQGKTVSVPAGYQVTVIFGSPPSPPVEISSVLPSSPSAGFFTSSMTPGMQSSGRGVPVFRQQLQLMPPVVVTTDPLPGATIRVGLAGRPITATFSVPMDPASLNIASFTLVRQGVPIVPVAGIVTYNLLTATFTPNVLVPFNAYTATITTAATSLTGLPMANDYVWTFHTN